MSEVPVQWIVVALMDEKRLMRFLWNLKGPKDIDG
jgi:hypothetical protein